MIRGRLMSTTFTNGTKISGTKINRTKIRETKIRALKTSSISLLILLFASIIAIGQGGVATGDLRVSVKDPAGNVVVGVYSSGAVGRLVPDDVAGLVRYLREHAPATA